METIKTVYKIGHGPSSSHTMGPCYASEIFLKKNAFASRFVVELYGSLAMTGKGHLTDKSIIDILGDFRTEVRFCPDTIYDYHPNGMKFFAYDGDKLIDEWLVFSVGGGDLKNLNDKRSKPIKDVYPHNKMTDIISYIKKNNMTLLDYIKLFDEDDLFSYLSLVFDKMEESIKRGLSNVHNLPGSLNLERKSFLFYKRYIDSSKKDFDSLLFALTLAVCEENASGGLIVTAPTCGSSGVIPGIIFSEYYHNNVPKEKLLEALAIAGLVCNLVRTNASISGAEVGCQGEVGVACAAGSAAITYLRNEDVSFIEYASEIALEHHLGMTCDPVDGLVQIPCIERNAMASKFSYTSSSYALYTNGKHHITLDSVISVMNETGKDIHYKYRETSAGGLALISSENKTKEDNDD